MVKDTSESKKFVFGEDKLPAELESMISKSSRTGAYIIGLRGGKSLRIAIGDIIIANEFNEALKLIKGDINGTS